MAEIQNKDTNVNETFERRLPERMRVMLSWSTGGYDGAAELDVDASAFLLGADGTVQRNADFVFYGNLQSGDGAVVHTGDNLKGGPGGDSEALLVDTAKLSGDVTSVLIALTIYEAQERGQSFSQVSDVTVRLTKEPQENGSRGELRFGLPKGSADETALAVCEIVRLGDEWCLKPIGAGYRGGLYALCKSLGVNV